MKCRPAASTTCSSCCSKGLYGFVHNIVGEKYMRYIFSFFMTIFLIVLLSNWLELVPGVDSIGFLEPHTTTDVDDRGNHLRAGLRDDQ